VRSSWSLLVTVASAAVKFSFVAWYMYNTENPVVKREALTEGGGGGGGDEGNGHFLSGFREWKDHRTRCTFL